MALTNMQVRDIETLVHPYTNLSTLRETGPLVIARAKGVRVYDDRGRDYIEGMAGLWCTSLGYGVEELAEVAAEQMRTLSYAHLFAAKGHEPAIALAEHLKEIAPMKVARVFFAASGSEANDSQVKFLWFANNARGRPEKKKFIARRRGYHGVTVVAASLTGLPANHRGWDLPLDFVRHTDCPHFYREAEPGEDEAAFVARLAGNLEALILEEGPETVAGFIGEPAMGAGGAILPPEGYWQAIAAVLKKYDVTLVADEVITGFGRLGTMFGCEAYDFTPDTMSIAKAMSSAYLPISGVLIGADLYEAFEAHTKTLGTFAHGYTYGGHPVACAVAKRVLEIYAERDIVGHVQRMAPIFAGRIHAWRDHPLVGQTQTRGLIGAMELVADKATKRAFPPEKTAGLKFCAFAQDEGLILRALLGDRVAFCPPLVITEAEIGEMFDRFDRAMTRFTEWVGAEGLAKA